MDLLSELRRRISEIGSHERTDGLRAAVRHLEVAERYLSRGRREEDLEVYNDVIYRTNQAFEGILKEAYSIFEGVGAGKLTINAIEQYFLDNKRLTRRAWDLFRNYRQHWRNPATHDHTLLFSEQEALLAIVSVSSFALVLLDQMVEKINFQRHKADAESLRAQISREISLAGNSNFSKHLVGWLELFIARAVRSRQRMQSEAELVGSLSGFFAGLAPELQVTSHVRLDDRHRADILLRFNEEVVIIEVKRGRAEPHLVQGAVAQLKENLDAANARVGVLCIWSMDDAKHGQASRLDLEGKEVWIIGAKL